MKQRLLLITGKFKIDGVGVGSVCGIRHKSLRSSTRCKSAEQGIYEGQFNRVKLPRSHIFYAEFGLFTDKLASAIAYALAKQFNEYVEE